MAENQELIPQENQEQSVVQQAAGIANIWGDQKALAQAWKIADFLSKSKLVPENYQGDNNKGNCLIAIDMAARLNISPLMVMQNLYVVKGKPSWAGQMCITLVNGCGRFTPLEFVYFGEGVEHGCYAKAQRIKDGSIVEGAKITMQMAKDEGWGAKWKTMPEQMLAYRAGAFFARIHCPDVLMGLQTSEEITDIQGEETPKTKTVISLEDDENAD